jgi:hypothetical protein
VTVEAVRSDEAEDRQLGNLLDSFFLAPQRCFRMLRSSLIGSAVHCDRPVVWKGPWRDLTGEVWMVEACELHRPQVDTP